MARLLRRGLAVDFCPSKWMEALQQTRKSAVASSGAEAATSSPQRPSRTSSGEGKRFYKKAIVKGVDEWFEISLDHRVLRTPAKKPFRLSNAALAHAIAAEWEWQGSIGLRSITMPLMKLASIAIDQIPADRERIISTMLTYCHTDALCCRATLESILYDKQARRWDPLLDWAKFEIGTRPDVSTSIFGPTQSQEYLKNLEKYLRGLDDWQLAAVDSLAGSARSIVVALAIARQRLTVDEAIDIIRLEENHQGWTALFEVLSADCRKESVPNALKLLWSKVFFEVEDWGYVEGGHDIDEADIKVQITAASVFL